MGDRKPPTVRFGAFVINARRSRIAETGSTEWYWELRLRQDGKDQRRAIGWCQDTLEASERALDVIQMFRTEARSQSVVVGSALLTTSIEAYHDAVPHLAALRPNTIRLRQYAARNLLEWARFEQPRLKCGELSGHHGHAYAAWLLSHGYARSTTNTQLTGARVYVRCPTCQDG